MFVSSLLVRRPRWFLRPRSWTTFLRLLPWILFVGQFLAISVMAYVEYQRFAVGQDFSAYYQAWYFIAHGNFNPPETAFWVSQFWHDHFVLLMWVLSPLYWIYPHGVTLLWVQAAAGVASEIVVWRIGQWWFSRANVPSRIQTVFSTILLALLVGNPWSYWGPAYDFHAYTVGAFTATLALYQFLKERPKRAYLAAALTLLGGDVVATYLVGLAISLLVLPVKGRRVHAALTAAMAFAFLGVFSLALEVAGHLSASAATSHAHPASAVGYLSYYSYITGPGVPFSMKTLLTGFFLHPGRWMTVVWKRRMHLLLVLGPSGVLGFFTEFGIGMPLIVLAQTFLATNPGYTTDFAQMYPVFALISLGTVIMLGRLYRHLPRFTRALTIMAMTNIGVWFAIWMSIWPNFWTPVPATTAGILQSVNRTTPRQEEIVASTGIMGRLSSRPWIYPLGPQPDPLHSRTTLIVLVPSLRVNEVKTSIVQGYIRTLSKNPQASLILHRNGVWVFRYRSSPGQSLALGSSPKSASGTP